MPADAPMGPLLVTIEPEEEITEIEAARAKRRANRARLAGELEGRIAWADDAFDPLTDEGLEDWYRPLEPDR